MEAADVAAVAAIAGRVHLAYPEDEEVFAERQRLYPEGCRLLEVEGRPVGYILTHPWRYLEPPSLNVRLGMLPADPTTYYIHDLVLLPEARGSGAATAVVHEIIAHAAATGAANVSLVAVRGTQGFWRRHGFEAVSEPRLDAKLASYDAEALYMVRPLP
jgi:ribosomal protein S18 acetylase RimI-like enzyme